MKLIIAGSRSITDYHHVRDAIIISKLWSKYREKLEVVCGMASGVDLLGKEFASKNSLVCHEFPAKWDDIEAARAVIKTRPNGSRYNVNAGFARNIEMGKFADGLLAIWDGRSRGTKQMIEWMQENDKFVYVHRVTA